MNREFGSVVTFHDHYLQEVAHTVGPEIEDALRGLVLLAHGGGVEVMGDSVRDVGIDDTMFPC